MWAHAWIHWAGGFGVVHEVLNWPALEQTTRFSFAFNRNYGKCATPFSMILISNLYIAIIERRLAKNPSQHSQHVCFCIGFIIRISQWLKYCVRCEHVVVGWCVGAGIVDTRSAHTRGIFSNKLWLQWRFFFNGVVVGSGTQYEFYSCVWQLFVHKLLMPYILKTENVILKFKT